MVAQISITAIINVSSYTIFVYDYMLTFGKEIDRFWKKPRLSWAFAFFIINRYLTLLGRIPAFMANFVRTNDDPYNLLSVVSMRFFHMIADLRGPGAVVMTLRVYAIFDSNRRILYLLVSVLVTTTAISFYFILDISPNYPKVSSVPPQGCLRAISQQEASHYAAAWGGQLVFDVMVFGLTVWRLFGIKSLGSHSLVDILLRDGAMYFAVMTVMNIANITTFLVANPNLKSIFSSPTNMICSTMISRLMMNIRDPSNEGAGSVRQQASSRAASFSRIGHYVFFPTSPQTKARDLCP